MDWSPPTPAVKPKMCQIHWDDRTVASIYVIGIREHPGYVKIGMADQPDRRLEKLQGANPFTLALLVSRQMCCRSMARRIERMLHWKYREHKTSSIEWFRLPESEVDLLVAMVRSGEIENV